MNNNWQFFVQVQEENVITDRDEMEGVEYDASVKCPPKGAGIGVKTNVCFSYYLFIMHYSTGSALNAYKTLQPHPEWPFSWHLQLNINDHTLIPRPPLLSKLVLSQLLSLLLQTQTLQRLAL